MFNKILNFIEVKRFNKVLDNLKKEMEEETKIKEAAEEAAEKERNVKKMMSYSVM